MVMETPTPWCIGHEFVRQYYTVLNKAPVSLYRFYSHDSSFVHGGHKTNSEAVVGQTNIRQKIMSLNFEDCHTKICSVDAQATIGDGVVVQVTGELSINRQPMRRFMQTFVLAAQSPKKYYVYNDIFRYQDEVFCDDEVEDRSGEAEVDSGVDAPSDTGHQGAVTSASVNGAVHSGVETRQASPLVTRTTPDTSPVRQTVTPAVTAALEVQASTTPAPPPTSGTHIAPAATSSVSMVDPAPPSPPPENDNWGAQESPQPSDNWGDEPAPMVDPGPESPVPEEANMPTQVTTPEQKTYANLLKASSTQNNSHLSNTSGLYDLNQTKSVQARNDAPRGIQGSSSPPSQTTPSSGGFVPRAPRVPSNQGRQSTGRDRSFRSSEDISDAGTADQVFTRPMRYNEGQDDKRRPTVPDSQQIFVGNLPHHAGEEQLKNEFSRFGKIVDVRINTSKGKTGPKGPGHTVPNFGFVMFEDEESVASCLSARPIYLNNDHRLNVEEKKARSRIEGLGMGRPGGRGMGPGMRPGMSVGGPPQGRGTGRGFNRDNSRGGGSGGPRGGGMGYRR